MVVGEFTQEVDVLVIGGGPAGYEAAFRAAELGRSVLIVDPRTSLGGACLAEACIPSKMMLHASGRAAAAEMAETAAVPGAMVDDDAVDWTTLRTQCDQMTAKLGGGLAARARALGVEHLCGRAKFADQRTAQVTDGEHVSRVRFRRAVIAIGAEAAADPALPFDGERVLSPAQSLTADPADAAMLVRTTSVWGLEIASILAGLGGTVHIVSATDPIADTIDADVMKPMLRALRRRVASLHMGTSAASITDQDGAFEAVVGDDTLRVDRLVLDDGVAPALDALALASLDIAMTDDGFIAVDDRMRTSNPRILAAGAATGAPTAGRALVEGRIAGAVASGTDDALDALQVPRVIFTDPEVAWVGCTEQEVAGDTNIAAVKVPWGRAGRAMALGRAQGVTKLVWERDSGLLLGGGMCGHGATEMIGTLTLALEMGAVLEDLAAICPAHPTIAELIGDAAREALAQAPPR